MGRKSWMAAQSLLHASEGLLSRNPVPVETPSCSSRTACADVDEEETITAEVVVQATIFFAMRRGDEKLCVDCGEGDADWASVSHGTSLCTDCAGMHRGLGVHLSFVRSTNMDRWGAKQLSRMQNGGNQRFWKHLCAAGVTLPAKRAIAEELHALYSSEAAASYRSQLNEAADPRKEAGGGNGGPQKDRDVQAAEEVAETLAEAQKALETAFTACQQKLDASK